MNIHYPVPELAHRSILGLMIAALFLGSVFPALQVASQSRLLRVAHPAQISTGQSIPQAIPVPQPPHHQSAPAPLGSVTPIPPEVQPRPVIEPVPTPPSVH